MLPCHSPVQNSPMSSHKIKCKLFIMDCKAPQHLHPAHFSELKSSQSLPQTTMISLFFLKHKLILIIEPSYLLFPLPGMIYLPPNQLFYIATSVEMSSFQSGLLLLFCLKQFSRLFLDFIYVIIILSNVRYFTGILVFVWSPTHENRHFVLFMTILS